MAQPFAVWKWSEEDGEDRGMGWGEQHSWGCWGLMDLEGCCARTESECAGMALS